MVDKHNLLFDYPEIYNEFFETNLEYRNYFESKLASMIALKLQNIGIDSKLIDFWLHENFQFLTSFSSDYKDNEKTSTRISPKLVTRLLRSMAIKFRSSRLFRTLKSSKISNSIFIKRLWAMTILRLERKINYKDIISVELTLLQEIRNNRFDNARAIFEKWTTRNISSFGERFQLTLSLEKSNYRKLHSKSLVPKLVDTRKFTYLNLFAEQINSFRLMSSYDVHQMSAFECKQLTISPNSSLFTNDEFMNLDFELDPSRTLNIDYDPSLKGSFASDKAVFYKQDESSSLIGGVNLIFGGFAGNYWHSMIEYLPKLNIANSDFEVLIPANIHPSLHEVLKKFFPEFRLIRLNPNSYVSTTNGYFFSNAFHMNERKISFDVENLNAVSKKLKHSLLFESRYQNIEKVFILRNKGNRKDDLKNLAKLAVENNFVVLDANNLTFQDFICIFSNAKHIVATAGAVWANLLYSNPNQKLVNIATDLSSGFNLHQGLADVLELELNTFLIPTLSEGLNLSYMDNLETVAYRATGYLNRQALDQNISSIRKFIFE